MITWSSSQNSPITVPDSFDAPADPTLLLVGAFSLKEKSPTITVGSFFFSLQSHSEWSTFYNLFICSVVHLRQNF